MAKLTFVLEDGQEVVVPLAGLITLGRDEDNDVVIDDERISRHHAELLSHGDGRIEVHDLGSTAGTFINDRPVRSHVIQRGDRLAFGPLAARIDFEDTPAAPVEETVRAEEERLAQLQAAIQDLSSQHEEKSIAVQKLAATQSTAQKEIESLAAQQEQEESRLRQLRQDCDQAEHRLGDLRRQLAEAEERSRASKTLADTLEDQTQAAGKKLDQLGQEQQQAQESILRVQTELTARENDLAAASRRFDEAKARLAETEAQCHALAITERQQEDAQAALQQVQTQLAAQHIALQKASSEESAAQDRLADLSAREKDLRAELVNLGPAIETARNERAGLESRLTPLRDWKKSMDRRYARLAMLAKGSAEESALWHEIEDAHAALFDLLPAARIETPGLTRGDFARISAKAGVPMKSDRIRRAGA